MNKDLLYYIKRREFTKAKKYLQDSLDHTPDDVYLLVQMANVEWNLYHEKEALPYILKAESIKPTDPLLLYTKGRILWSLGNYDEALVPFEKIIQSDIEGLSMNGFGKKWALSLQNDSRYYKAECLYFIHQDSDALSSLEEHLKKRKRGLESEFSLKEVKRLYNILTYAIKYTNKKYKKENVPSPSQNKQIWRHVESLERQKKNDKVIPYLKRKNKEYPDDYFIQTTLSEYMINKGNYEESLHYAFQAYDSEPSDMLTVYNYGRALFFCRQYDEAVSILSIIEKNGMEYAAYSEHGEGLRWAKSLLKRTRDLINKCNDQSGSEMICLSDN